MSIIESIPPHSSGVNPAPASGQAFGASLPSIVKDSQKHESMLGEMAKVSTDTKFEDELATIEEWFKVLNESERTTALHALIQHSSQDQLQLILSAIQKKIRPSEERKPTAASDDGLAKTRLGKLILRPPSLHLADPVSPMTPTPNTATNQSIAEAVNNLTTQEINDPNASIPGIPGINPQTLNMLANAGLSNEAQLLAAQLVMNGLVKPTGLLQQSLPKSRRPILSSNWRTPTSARYPSSALRSSGLRPPPSALKSAGLKSSGLDSATITDSPREEDFDPEMLKDIPTWLRGLRLHKYTQCFEGMPWEAIVVLDDATLEARGVAALGARRRLLRTFEHVRKRMGMEEPDNATPTTSVMPTPAVVKPASEQEKVPQSAFPRSKLSINSPVFTPRESKVPITPTPAPKAPATTVVPASPEAPTAVESAAGIDSPSA